MPYDGYIDPDYAREKREKQDIGYYGDDDDEDYWTGHGSDDGYDAMKDANAEAGRAHNHPAGFNDARRNGWLRKAKAEPIEDDENERD